MTTQHETPLSGAQARLATATAATTVGIAGPGSGKTHTLIERYAIWQSRITWIVTFTQNAAIELRSRIGRMNLPAPDFCGTLHALALRELRRHGRPDIVLLDEAEAEELMKEAIDDTRSKITTTGLRKALTAETTTQQERILIMRYRSKLRQTDAEDFDTLLVAFLELCNARRIHTEHLMVDEYQDSGAQDHRIYGAIHADTRFIVGDPDQSIYGWRGGRIENLLEVASDHGTFTGFLEDNYRSTPQICTAAQNLIAHNRNRIEKTTTGMRESGEPVSIWEFQSEIEEAATIAEYASRHPATAVLCRYNADRIRIQTAMEAAGINMAKETPTTPKDFKFAMTCLKITAAPEHPHAVMTYLRATIGAERAAAAKLEAYSAGRPLKAPAAPNDLTEWCERFGLSFDTRSLMMDAMRSVGAGSMKEKASEMQLWLRAYATEPAPALNQTACCLTVHASKGMEFDRVIVQGVEDNAYGRTPEEDRRLLYVAMTRARFHLILTTAKSRMNTFKRAREEQQPSRFLTELTAKA